MYSSQYTRGQAAFEKVCSSGPFEPITQKKAKMGISAIKFGTTVLGYAHCIMHIQSNHMETTINMEFYAIFLNWLIKNSKD